MVPDADYRIKLPVFEGPLDLLLFLIRKNEIDIYDIPIEAVTRQYIDALHSLQELDLDIAGEFFVMAATLMEIKSRMLLPRGQAAVDLDADEDEMDPRWELVHQLLQYKKFKEAAQKLDELAVFQHGMLARHVSQLAASESERPLKSVDRIELWNAFNIVLRRLSEKLVVGEITDEQVTVADKMEEMLELGKTKRSFLFTDLFTGPVTVRVLVATFLAILELTRLKKMRVHQEEAFADIICSYVDDPVTSPSPDTDTPAATLPSADTSAAGATTDADTAPAEALAVTTTSFIVAETFIAAPPDAAADADAFPAEKHGATFVVPPTVRSTDEFAPPETSTAFPREAAPPAPASAPTVAPASEIDLGERTAPLPETLPASALSPPAPADDVAAGDSAEEKPLETPPEARRLSP